MTGALTPDQRWALIERYGNVDDAITEALKRSPELQELWDSQYTAAWWPNTRDFWKVWWKRALPVLGIDAAPQTLAADEKDEHEPRRRSTRGGPTSSAW